MFIASLNFEKYFKLQDLILLTFLSDFL